MTRVSYSERNALNATNRPWALSSAPSSYTSQWSGGALRDDEALENDSCVSKSDLRAVQEAGRDWRSAP